MQMVTVTQIRNRCDDHGTPIAAQVKRVLEATEGLEPSTNQSPKVTWLSDASRDIEQSLLDQSE